jgi:transposase
MNTDTPITPHDPIFCGIDLHSNNLVLALVNAQGQRLAHRKVPCELPKVLEWLRPWKPRLERLAVESTYNWYWLVDGLEDAGYPIVVANPAKFQPYEGLKHSTDLTDAWFIAELLRLKILPTGYKYDRHTRPVRDLLRRRSLLVRQRTSLYLSAKSLHSRVHGTTLPLAKLKSWTSQDGQDAFTHPADRLVIAQELQLIEQLTQSIRQIERAVLVQAKPRPEFSRLQSLPGVGLILGLTLLLEIGDIQRFPRPENLASYARCVAAQRLSNGKGKGDNNRKCGNRYLGWALVEAAHCAIRSDARAQQYYQRKAAATLPVVATKALACKLCKAAWHVWHDGVDYDPLRTFGPEPVMRLERISGERSVARRGTELKPLS